MAQTLFPKQTFYEHQKMNPCWSDFTCFCETIRGRKYLRRPTITKWFNTLVDSEDYGKEDKGEVLGFLFNLAREVE